MKTKKILLTGASGTVGQEILKILVFVPEYEIFIFDFIHPKSRKFYQKFGKRIQLIHGDISSIEDVNKIPDHIDIVFHMAAIIPPKADLNPERTHQVNVLGTKYLIQHMEKGSPNAFFLYSSSVSVYGDRVENPNISVQDPVHISDGDFYGKSKLEAEDIVQKSNLKWTIFRLTAIMKNHKISKLMFHMPLETCIEICTPEDTARAFVNAINHEEDLKFRIFNLGGGDTCCISYKDFLEKSFELFGLGRFNFPKYAFAEKNFHCGKMMDGEDLEKIVHFRNDSIESYFIKTAHSISPLKRFLTKPLRQLIKKRLLSKSEPYHAYRKKNQKEMEHFFKSIPSKNKDFIKNLKSK